MLKKEEVFVRVSSEKKARKLKELLEMFGEMVYANDSIDEALERGCGLHHDGQEWLNISSNRYNKTKVSLKELRNILAKEHLESGDVVVFDCGFGEYILKIESIEDELKVFFNKFINNGKLLNHCDWINIKHFLRYATEEERQLLFRKKELQEGKWYKHPDYPEFLSIHATDGNRYGFDIDGIWFENHPMLSSGSEYTEATPQEVEEALIKESKRRYKFGDKLSKVQDDNSEGNRIFSLKLSFRKSDGTLWIYGDCGYSSCIFKNGKWAEVVESDNNDLEQLEKILADAQVLVYKLKNK